VGEIVLAAVIVAATVAGVWWVPRGGAPERPGGGWARHPGTWLAVVIALFFVNQVFFTAFVHQAWHDDTPLDWTDVPGRAEHVALFRDLVALRRNSRNTTAGLRGTHLNVHHLNDTDKVIAYHRWARGGPRDDVVVLANLSAREWPAYRIGMPRSGRWQVRLNTDWAGYDADFGGVPVLATSTDAAARDGMACSASIALPAYGAIVLSQDG